MPYYVPRVFEAGQVVPGGPQYDPNSSQVIVVIVQPDEPLGVKVGTLWYDTDATP